MSELTRARDAHRAATLLTLLVLLWGAVSLLEMPWQPFGTRNVVQVVGCSGALVYLLRARHHPAPRVSYMISAVLIVYSLLVLPWTAVMWCRLGRPLEAFIVPRVGMICMALVIPGRWWLGMLTMSLFAAESAFVLFYARHLGLDAAIPTNEPLASFCFFALAVGVLVVRRHRHRLALQHVSVQAELHALDRTRPVLERASRELVAQVDAVTAALQHGAGRVNGTRTRVCRALERLGSLSDQLGYLVRPHEPHASAEQAERALLARDAQLGALLFAAVAVAMGLPMTLWGQSMIGAPLSWILAAAFSLDLLILLWLVRTWRQPSSRRTLWAVAVVFGTALAIADYAQYQLLLTARPYVPFLGHKLLMCVLGLTLTTRFRLGVVLIIITAANAVALWFALSLHANTHIVTASEPWLTLIVMSIGLACLRMHEQRKIASIQLLRAETMAASLQRRARMFFALRDRLNTPLQTLVFAGPALHVLTDHHEQIDDALDRLVRLSHELAELDEPLPVPSPDVDADEELRRHV